LTKLVVQVSFQLKKSVISVFVIVKKREL